METNVPESFMNAVNRTKSLRLARTGAQTSFLPSPKRDAPNPPLNPKEDDIEYLMNRALYLQDIGRLEQAAEVLVRIEELQEEATFLIENQQNEEAGLVGEKGDNDDVSDIGSDSDDSDSSNDSDGTIRALKLRDKLEEDDTNLDETFSVTEESLFPEKPPKLEEPQDSQETVEVTPSFHQKDSTVTEEETAKVAEIKKVISSLAEDNLLLMSGNVMKSPLEMINEKLKGSNVTNDAKPSKSSSLRHRATPSHSSNSKRMVTKAGNLLLGPEEGKLFSKWRKKYFVLSGRFILFFKSDKSRKCEGLIELSGAVVEAVAMQIKAKQKDVSKTEFEVRIREEGSKRIFRLRSFVEMKKNKMQFFSEEVLRKETFQWASSIRNNVLVASKNADFQRKELERMKPGSNASAASNWAKVRNTFKAMKGFNQNLRQASNSNQEIKLIAHESKKAALKHKQEKLEEADENIDQVDEERRKKHFSVPKTNGAPMQIGVDVGKRNLDEEIFDLYKILNVTPMATSLMIKKSYRELARDLHPDKNISNSKIAQKSATARFAKVGRAFDVLKDKKTREEYDNCEKVKEILRKGVIVRLHRHFDNPCSKILFTDERFLNLYLQDARYGTVLQKGFKSIELRFVTHVYRGADGFREANRDVHVEGVGRWGVPSSVASSCLSLHGDRLGEQDWHIQLGDSESRDQLLRGLRKLRCDFSELFKQRLEEMQAKGMM